MTKAFSQGYLDSLCGIYSILNADKIVNNTPETESLNIFMDIIEFLDGRGTLKDTILYGSDHSLMKTVIRSLGKSRFPLCITNKRGILKLKDWWSYSREFLEGGKNRTIILSLGGKVLHLTVIERMSDRNIFLRDSNWRTSIRKSMCRMMGYTETDKYIIYPSQCWYLGKE